MSESRIPTPHINAPAGAFAETVLMPGDPLRSKLIAERFLENAQLVNTVRGVQGYTGTWQGKRVSVMASGMGCPSMGIYSYELFRFYGVENIIRIGSAGAMSEKIKVRDIVLGMSAYTDSAYMKIFGFSGDCAPCADYGLLSRAVETARQMSLRAHCGSLYTCDAFYAENSPNNAILQKLGVLAVEMEAYALYLNAARARKNALALLTISDNPYTGETCTAQEVRETFTQMMEIALEIA